MFIPFTKLSKKGVETEPNPTPTASQNKENLITEIKGGLRVNREMNLYASKCISKNAHFI